MEERRVQNEDKIELQVENKVEEYLEEKFEREQKNNLVIFGLQEAPADIREPEDSVKYDQELVIQLYVGVNDELKVKQEEIQQTYGLGKWRTDPQSKPRSLCIKLKTEEKKCQLLRSAKKLKEAAEGSECGKKKEKKSGLSYQTIPSKKGTCKTLHMRN